MLVGKFVGCPRGGRRGETGATDPREGRVWKELCAALDLRPDVERTDVTRGARTERVLAPRVPNGWRFEPTDDGVGVLAPASAFASGPFTTDGLDSEASTVARAKEHLAASHPASALLTVKNGVYEDALNPLVELAREAYLALGRAALAQRASAWLEAHPAE
jgi:hypothetical protein